MKYRRRRGYARMFLQNRDQQLKFAHKIIERQIKREQAAVKRIAKKNSDIKDLKAAIRKYYRKDARKEWKQIFHTLWTESGKSTVRLITDYYTGKKSIITYATKQDDELDEYAILEDWETYAAIYLTDTGTTRVNGITYTTEDDLIEFLDEELEGTESSEDIQSGLADKLGAIWEGRIDLVSLLEIAAIVGGATILATKLLMPNEYKTWVTVGDDKVREWHMDAEIEYSANPIPIDEPFIVDGEELMFPGDPAGSDSNIINCRCFEENVEITEE